MLSQNTNKQALLAWCFLAASLLVTHNDYSQIQMAATHNHISWVIRMFGQCLPLNVE